MVRDGERYEGHVFVAFVCHDERPLVVTGQNR